MNLRDWHISEIKSQWHTVDTDKNQEKTIIITPPEYSDLTCAKLAYNNWRKHFSDKILEISKKKKDDNSKYYKKFNEAIDAFISIANSAIETLDNLVNNFDDSSDQENQKNHQKHIEEYAHFLTLCWLSLFDLDTPITIDGQPRRVGEALTDFESLQKQITKRLPDPEGQRISHLFTILKEGGPRFLLGTLVITGALVSGTLPAIFVGGMCGFFLMRSGYMQANNRHRFFQSSKAISDLREKVIANNRIFNKVPPNPAEQQSKSNKRRRRVN